MKCILVNDMRQLRIDELTAFSVKAIDHVSDIQDDEYTFLKRQLELLACLVQTDLQPRGGGILESERVRNAPNVRLPQYRLSYIDFELLPFPFNGRPIESPLPLSSTQVSPLVD